MLNYCNTKEKRISWYHDKSLTSLLPIWNTVLFFSRPLLCSQIFWRSQPSRSMAMKRYLSGRGTRLTINTNYMFCLNPIKTNTGFWQSFSLQKCCWYCVPRWKASSWLTLHNNNVIKMEQHWLFNLFQIKLVAWNDSNKSLHFKIKWQSSSWVDVNV